MQKSASTKQRANLASREGIATTAITTATTTAPRPLVRAKVIADLLDVSSRCVALWAQNGIIPCVRIGGTLRFDLDAVMREINKPAEAAVRDAE